MKYRTSKVENIGITDVTLSSVFQVGDSKILQPRSKALAVQRQIPFYYGNEGDFNQFPIFKEPIPKPRITEEVQTVRYNERPDINVANINIIGAAASSIIHIGSSQHIDAETRVKHIRQFIRR